MINYKKIAVVKTEKKKSEPKLAKSKIVKLIISNHAQKASDLLVGYAFSVFAYIGFTLWQGLKARSSSLAFFD